METHPLRVLVVEPDHIACNAVLDVLRPLGCDAIVAADGREALVEALLRRPSVIVMGSRLPLVNGPALCEILRRDSQTHSVPIVALAGDPGNGDVERISRAGGVSDRHAEQWDDYTCPTCGALEFRHRTRKLRERTSHG